MSASLSYSCTHLVFNDQSRKRHGECDPPLRSYLISKVPSVSELHSFTRALFNRVFEVPNCSSVASLHVRVQCLRALHFRDRLAHTLKCLIAPKCNTKLKIVTKLIGVNRARSAVLIVDALWKENVQKELFLGSDGEGDCLQLFQYILATVQGNVDMCFTADVPRHSHKSSLHAFLEELDLSPINPKRALWKRRLQARIENAASKHVSALFDDILIDSSLRGQTSILQKAPTRHLFVASSMKRKKESHEPSKDDLDIKDPSRVMNRLS